MPVNHTATDKCVRTIIQKIKDTFDGFGDDAVEEFYNIMIGEVRALVESVRKEAMASAAQVSTEPEKPALKKVNNYTMFGSNFRKEHPEIKEDMFKRIADAWNLLTEAEKEEWKAKAKEENSRLRESYVAEHGDPPKKGRRKNRPKTTNPFQEFVKEFRGKNPKVGHRDVFREASASWNKLTEKQKSKYVEQATALRAQFSAEWEEEQLKNPQPVSDGGRKKRVKKLAPKRKSGYILFGAHWREKLNKEKLTGKQAMSSLAEAWNALSEKDKTKYNTQANKDNDKIVKTFLKENPESDWAVKHSPESGVGAAAAAVVATA